jgi:UDP-N-acetylmuramate dehydrogenase
MTIRNDVDLQPLTSFRTRGGRAHTFYHATTLAEAIEIAQTVAASGRQWFMLGGGSNVLITRPVDQVVRVDIRHCRILDERSDEVTVEFGAGNRWHDCVQWAVEHGLAGIEALALIPGTVGAAPIQNIGAYGQQLSDVCVWVEGIELPSGNVRRLSHHECQFGYRDSIFKRQLRDRFIVTSIALRLEKRRHATITYAELAHAMNGAPTPTIDEVFNRVVALRRSKLPPEHIGSAGSFFKNPVVPIHQADALRQEYPSMPQYPNNGSVKLSAGWLIEQCGFKGVRRGDAGVYERHALVLVNYGNAHATDILELASEIKETVRSRFGVLLEEEVVIV